MPLLKDEARTTLESIESSAGGLTAGEIVGRGARPGWGFDLQELERALSGDNVYFTSAHTLAAVPVDRWVIP